MLIITFIIAVIALILAIAQTIRNDKFTEIKNENDQYKEWFKHWDKVIKEVQTQQMDDWLSFVDYTKAVKPLLDKNSTKYAAILTQLNELQHAIYEEGEPDDNSINIEESAQTNQE